jgi:hypothetical protein
MQLQQRRSFAREWTDRPTLVILALSHQRPKRNRRQRGGIGAVLEVGSLPREQWLIGEWREYKYSMGDAVEQPHDLAESSTADCSTH